MCDEVMVCHGQIVEKTDVRGVYTPKQAKLKKSIASSSGNDCKPATFYVTLDGKYAVDADFVSLSDLQDPNFDLKSVPKIKLVDD